MTDHSRALATRSPIGTLALVVLLTIGCDAVTPGVGSTLVTSSPAPSASATAAPSLTDVVPVRPPTSPSPMRAAAPPASPTPEPRREAFAMSLYRKGDYVAQYTLEWCVGASLQMTLNMATDQTRTSRASQQALWEMARARSNSPFGGANPRGWTAALNDLGIGPYVLVSFPDLDEALRVAATALRTTRRPVGLVMWRGRHAWVMSGSNRAVIRPVTRTRRSSASASSIRSIRAAARCGARHPSRTAC